MRSTRFVLVALLFAAASVLNSSAASAAPTTNGGPGGVGDTTGSSSLRLWLRGDAGVTTISGGVSQWADQSGFGSNFIQTSSTNRATYTATQNGIPVLSFSNPGNQFLNAPVAGFTLGGSGGATTYAAYTQNVGAALNYDQNGLPFFARSTAYFGMHSNDNAPTNISAYTVPGAAVGATINGIPSGTFAEGTWGTIQGTHASTSPALNGVTFTDLQVGHDVGARYLDGAIGEIVFYNTTLNTAEQTLVQNYISSKYDTLLAGAVDKYNGDTVGFDYGVSGVGRVDASNQSLNGGMDGFGIQVASLTDNTWALGGHENGPNGVTTADVPTGPWILSGRWERSWFVDTNIVGTADLAFNWINAGNTAPFDPGFNTLLARATNSGPFSIVATGLVDTVNQRVDFTGITLQDGFYYTLGVALTVPEPSTLGLLGLGVFGMAVKARRRRSAA